MRRYLSSLIVALVFASMLVIAQAPSVKSGVDIPADQCLAYCQDQAICLAICQCAKILGGSLRLTQCNIGASCEFTGNATECVCDVDPICALWEKDKVVQSFPPENPDCQLCGNGIREGTENCDGTDNCGCAPGNCVNECSFCNC